MNLVQSILLVDIYKYKTSLVQLLHLERLRILWCSRLLPKMLAYTRDGRDQYRSAIC